MTTSRVIVQTTGNPDQFCTQWDAYVRSLAAGIYIVDVFYTSTVSDIEKNGLNFDRNKFLVYLKKSFMIMAGIIYGKLFLKIFFLY